MVLWGIWDFTDMIPSARAEALGITNKECLCVNKMSSRQQIDCMYEWYRVSTKTRVHYILVEKAQK